MDHSTDDARRPHDDANPRGPEGLPLGMMPGLNTNEMAPLRDPMQREPSSHPLRTFLWAILPVLGVAAVLWFTVLD